MSSPSSPFECRWRASRLLLRLYLACLLLALLALCLAAIPLWARCVGAVLLLLHAAWALPQQVLLNSSVAFTGLRHDTSGWQVWSAAGGWQAVQLRPDSLALPAAVILRFRLVGERRLRGLCIPHDALPRDLHRRLRVRLKFSRHRWQAPE